MITKELITDIRNQFQIDWHGIHGISHWNRVYENGTRLATRTGVNHVVVQLFSIFHDACRHNEGIDPKHGPRGAELAAQYRATHFQSLPDDEFEQLFIACFLHTSASTHDDITVQTCFDSDRLDLGRVGTIPDPQYLCTAPAKSEDMINWALENSEWGRVPDNILGQYVLQN